MALPTYALEEETKIHIPGAGQAGAVIKGGNEFKHEHKREQSSVKLESYIRSVPTVESSNICKEVVAVFKRNPDSECIVVSNHLGHVEGFLMRNRFFLKLGNRFSADLFYEKTIDRLMDTEPLIVDLTSPPKEVIDAALGRHESVLYDCVIVTRGGRFAGVLTVADLLKLSRSLQDEAAVSRARMITSVEQRVREIEGSVKDVRESSAKGETLSEVMVDLTLQGKNGLDKVTKAFDTIAATSRHQEKRIAELESEAGSISKVSQLIKELAEQSNLLALNASIEAARAGAHGRGFAVVAGEVMNLANQTKKSASEITALTKSILEAIGQTAELARTGLTETAASEVYVREAESAFTSLFQAAADNRGSAKAIESRAEQAHSQANHVAEELVALRQSTFNTTLT